MVLRLEEIVDVPADAACGAQSGGQLQALEARIAGGQHHADMFGGWGAHGWRGRWLVNGSSAGIVQLDLEPRQRAWLLSIWPLTLRVLYVSLDDPHGFLAAIGSGVA